MDDVLSDLVFNSTYYEKFDEFRRQNEAWFEKARKELHERLPHANVDALPVTFNRRSAFPVSFYYGEKFPRANQSKRRGYKSSSYLHKGCCGQYPQVIKLEHLPNSKDIKHTTSKVYVSIQATKSGKSFSAFDRELASQRGCGSLFGGKSY